LDPDVKKKLDVPARKGFPMVEKAKRNAQAFAAWIEGDLCVGESET
jgi:hypothetical protein